MKICFSARVIGVDVVEGVVSLVDGRTMASDLIICADGEISLYLETRH